MGEFESRAAANNISKHSLHADGVSIIEISDNIINLAYPHNVELSALFFKQQDSFLNEEYLQAHANPAQLLIQLDGISELLLDCKAYLQSKAHQSLYASAAFVLSEGNMAVLERHYLQQLFSGRLNNNNIKHQSDYPVGIFNDNKLAKNWLSSRPGSHYRH